MNISNIKGDNNMSKDLIYFSTRLPKDLKYEIKMEAFKEGITFQEATIRALKFWLEKKDFFDENKNPRLCDEYFEKNK